MMRVFATTLCFALMVLGCREASPSRSSDPFGHGFDRQRLASFERYPLVWLGEEYEGLPLVQVSERPRNQDSTGFVMDSVDFVYGTCKPRQSSGSCPVPLTIIVDGPCSPIIGDSVSADGQRSEPADTSTWPQIRSAPYTFSASGIQIVTDYNRISIHSVSPDISAVDVAADLVGANTLAEGLGSGDPFTEFAATTQQAADEYRTSC